MSESATKTKTSSWQPTTAAISESHLTPRPFPLPVNNVPQVQASQDLEGYRKPHNGDMIDNVRRYQQVSTTSQETKPTATTARQLIAPAPQSLSYSIQPKLTIGEPGDRYEQEADQVAAEVVQRINSPVSVQRRELRMPPTSSLASQPNGFTQGKLKPQIQRQIEFGGGEATTELESQTGRVRLRPEQHLSSLVKPLITVGEAKIQRYTEVSKGSQGYRIADDQSTVVQQDSKYGSQTLWAEAGKAKMASKQLEVAKSVIRLEEVGSPLTLKQKGVVIKTLRQVKPKNLSNKTSGTGSSGMKLWADCGKSARDVIGTGKGTGGGTPKAVYTNPSGKSATTTGGSDPASMKREILLTFVLAHEKTTGKTLLDRAKLKTIKQKRDKATLDWNNAKNAGKDAKILDDLAAKYFYWDEQITSLIVECYYTKISEKEREALNKQAGIDQWADPGVGQGYTMSTGGAEKPGHEKDTWNFHWAGVVMKSNNGNDHITLENYAVGDANVQNTEWVYQMYGSAKAAESDPSKKGQTFHEQHRDIHGQHGETPTTMTVTPG